MVDSVLVVTPSVGFGALIHQALEGVGDFEISLETTADGALQRLAQRSFALCILDADIVEVSLPELWKQIREAQPGLQLVLVSPDLGLSDSLLEDLSPDGVLNKPFYMPDLLSTVTQLLAYPGDPGERGVRQQPVEAEPLAPGVDLAERPPLWLEDVDRAAQHLTRLSLESAAQAALILRSEELWAYAGELSQPAVNELARAVADYWATDGGSDLARFIRLDATGGEYMLYATAIHGEFVLSLAFDARTPFSEIRSQAAHLARSLGTSPQERMVLAQPPEATVRDAVEAPALDQEDWTPPDLSPPERLAADSAQELLGPGPWIPGPAGDRALRQAPPDRLKPLAEEEQAEQPEADAAGDEAGADTKQDAPPETSTEGPPSLLLNPASPAVHHLGYACLLIPRLPQHQLHGDLATRLEEWVPQLSLSFGWRLVNLIVQVDRLGWIASMSPEHSPAWMVERIRVETSRRIFSAFPALAEENISGDFWAPGYLVVGSMEWPSARTVNAFMNRTRTWQGFNSPR